MRLVTTALPSVAAWLGDEKMGAGARRHLRRVGDREHLHALGKAREAHADRVGDGAADGGVDLVEDQRRRRAAIGERHLQREQEARELAAGGDLHQRAGPRAGIGADEEGDLVDAALAGAGRVSVDGDDELGALELQRRQLGRDRLSRRRCAARRRCFDRAAALAS